MHPGVCLFLFTTAHGLFPLKHFFKLLLLVFQRSWGWWGCSSSNEGHVVATSIVASDKWRYGLETIGMSQSPNSIAQRLNLRGRSLKFHTFTEKLFHVESQKPSTSTLSHCNPHWTLFYLVFFNLFSCQKSGSFDGSVLMTGLE